VAQFGRVGCLGTTWATKNLPARLDVAATAKPLGFAESDIQVLMAVGRLTPLGDPAPIAPTTAVKYPTVNSGGGFPPQY